MRTVSEPGRGGRAWILPLALVPFLLVVTGKLIASNEERLRAITPGCIFHDVTGLHCPGCGATRAVFAMARGDYRTAWTMNQILWIGLGLGLFYFIIAVMARRPGSTIMRRPWARLPAAGGWVIAGGVLLFGVLRNLPYWPFTLLAPH